jgi:hypothetical protein
MAGVVRNVWVGNHAPDLPRRDRGSCEYDAYLPDSLAGRSFSFLGPVAADVSEAEAAIVRLNESATGLQDTEPSPVFFSAPSRSRRHESRDWRSVAGACSGPNSCEISASRPPT